MEKVFDRTAKVIYSLFINIVIYPLAVSNSNCPELADTKGFLFAKKVILKVKSLTHTPIWMRLVSGRLCKAFRTVVIVLWADYSFIIAESALILP